MEAGRTIYFKGNTVAAPHPNAKNRQKRRIMAASPVEPENKIMPVERKVCATSQCVWCSNSFPEGVYLIICMHCHVCQYCGLVSHRNDACAYCGNILPEDLKEIKAVSDIAYSNKKRLRV